MMHTPARRGRPRRVPEIERGLGKTLLQHIMEQMTAGASLRAIGDDLGVSYDTLRRYLRKKGYKVICETRLVLTSPPRAERSVAARSGCAPRRP